MSGVAVRQNCAALYVAPIDAAFTRRGRGATADHDVPLANGASQSRWVHS